MMMCRYRWLEGQRRHSELRQLEPCGECDECRGLAPRHVRADQPPRKHMTCRYHWLRQRRREPDVEPCGRCQQCEATGTTGEKVSAGDGPADTSPPDTTHDEEVRRRAEELGIKVHPRAKTETVERRIADEEAARARELLS